MFFFFCREFFFYLGNVVASTSIYEIGHENGHCAFITCAVSETAMISSKGMFKNAIFVYSIIYRNSVYTYNIQISIDT